ncbi:hypothetical protein ACO34A_01030 [Rhizobium sp. ACO-34A]|nr:LuxR C-terminal-related transcriptional regulator [Rhizobium sp. ACO-34A]ATN32395.1 hypothetical protein ACO34A_01030 [Rhizobium sp. ACO-34A]
MTKLNASGNEPRDGAILSRPEIQCLTLVAEGKRLLDICNHLVLAEIQVEDLLQSAQQKLGARNRMHAVSLAMLAGAIRHESHSKPE